MYLSLRPTKIVLSGKVDGYDYSADISPASFFDKIRIIGPAESLEKITAEGEKIIKEEVLTSSF